MEATKYAVANQGSNRRRWSHRKGHLVAPLGRYANWWRQSCLVDAIQFPDREMSSACKSPRGGSDKSDSTHADVPTVAMNTIHEWEMDGEKVVCDFWDTAGQEQFHHLRQMAYNGASVVVVGFKMTDPDSLANVIAEDGWFDEVELRLPGFQHWILCGTQHDLWDSSNSEHCQEENIHEVLTAAHTRVKGCAGGQENQCQECHLYLGFHEAQYQGDCAAAIVSPIASITIS